MGGIHNNLSGGGNVSSMFVAKALAPNDPNDPNHFAATTSEKFGLAPGQLAADQAAIGSLGEQQYGDTMAAIDNNSAGQQQYTTDTLNQLTPQISDTLASQNIAPSPAYGQEIARQSAMLSQNLAAQNAQQRQGALQGLQGFQLGGLQRRLSFEDFLNSANVAKAIGAKTAPPPPSSKGRAFG